MAATNDFAGRSTPVFPTNAVAVTPDDNNDLGHVTTKIYIGGAGALKVDMAESGTAITFAALPVGTMLEMRVKRIYSSGTAATNIIALW